MKTAFVRRVTQPSKMWMAACVLIAALFGCNGQSQQAARNSRGLAKGPEASFERILERLKRRLEQGPPKSISTPMLDAGNATASRFSYHEEVTGEIQPPDAEGANYTAQVVIKTHSDYIHSQRLTDPPENDPQDADAGDDPLSFLLDDAEGEPGLGEDLLLPNITAPTIRPDPKESKENGIGKIDTEFIDKDWIKAYDLEYQGGKWVLMSEVEEESLRAIFEYALEGQ